MSDFLLRVEHDQAHAVFSIVRGEAVCPVSTWSTERVVGPSGSPLNIAPLLALLETETVRTESDHVLVPWDIIASASPAQLRSLALPEPYRQGVELERRGLVSDQDFSVSYRFIRLNGQPFTSAKRIGAIVRIASKEYTLLSPVYEAVSAIDGWKTGAQTERSPLEAAGELLEALGEVGTQLRKDAYLGSIRITTASGFTIRPYLNKVGSPDFDPVLAKRDKQHSTMDTHPENSDEETAAALPEAKEEAFAKQFRSFRDVKNRYAVGDGWLVIVPPTAQKALQVAKSYQSATPAARREFIRNPRAAIRKELEAEFDETELESLFWESEEYAERVRDIGVREPKVVPFVVRPSQPWLPPEQVGLEIDGQRVVVDRTGVRELEELLESAASTGESSVEFLGQVIPVTEQSREAVRQLADFLKSGNHAENEEPEDPEIDSGDEPEIRPPGPIALLVDDNLAEVTFRAEPRLRGDVEFGTPSQLTAQLYPHQEQGLRWLQEAWASGLPGILLADDMGLGKTLQVLAFLVWVRERRPHDSRPILIVAPTGLIKVWIAEHDTHLGHEARGGSSNVIGLGHPIAVTGRGLRDLRLADAARGKETDGGLPVLDVQRLREAPWVLTTYETLRDYQHSFGRVDWGVLVLDEVQKIKNPVALATDAVKAMNTDFRVALTGTPVENHIADLWSIIDVTYPGRLGSLKEFVQRHQSPEDFQSLREDLIEATPPAVMLRRMKVDHLRGLPEIIHHQEEGRQQMPPAQASAYDEIVETARRSSGKGFMMTCLQRLRLTSVHPDPFSTDSDDDFIRASAKLVYLFNILNQAHERSEKCLVFLESLDMQGALAALIHRRYSLSRMPMILNGAVAGARRSSMVETFQAEPDQFDVMILSPKAGGVGLTLTEANHVIHLMRWWNPAVEDQATDRVYRIGQRRPVHVYLPSAVHPVHGEYSFDLKLHQLLERKRTMSRQLFAPDSFNDGDIESLFNDSTRGPGDSR